LSCCWDGLCASSGSEASLIPRAKSRVLAVMSLGEFARNAFQFPNLTPALFGNARKCWFLSAKYRSIADFASASWELLNPCSPKRRIGAVGLNPQLEARVRYSPLIAKLPSFSCYYCALMKPIHVLLALLAAIPLSAQRQSFTIEQVMSSPFP